MDIFPSFASLIQTIENTLLEIVSLIQEHLSQIKIYVYQYNRKL